jgi:hypothetical protein
LKPRATGGGIIAGYQYVSGTCCLLETAAASFGPIEDDAERGSRQVRSGRQPGEPGVDRLEGSWQRRLLLDLGILPLQLNHHASQAAHFPGALRRRPRTGIRCVPRSQGSTISSDLSPIETGESRRGASEGARSNPLLDQDLLPMCYLALKLARGLGI